MQNQAPAPGFFIRPATIEIRCRTADDYANAKVFYTKIFGEPVEGKEACSFYIVTPKKDSSQLLLAHKGAFLDGNQTIVYWQVAGTTMDQLSKESEAVLQSLPNAGEHEGPYLDDRITIPEKDYPGRSILQDGAGNYLGLVINPSIPLTDRSVRVGPPPNHAPDLSICLALAASLGIGIVVGKLWR